MRAKANILNSIGNTPLIRLERKFPKPYDVYAKLEGINPGGSMKDRTADSIITNLLKSGIVSRGDTIIESSSGNMAVGLAQACLFYGLRLVVVVDPKLNPQTEKLLKAYSADIVMVRKPKPNGGYLAARLDKVRELLRTIPGSFWSNQYGNPNNPMAYHQVMQEIFESISKVDYMFIATSTCGSLMGCSDFIVQRGLNTKLIAVDAIGSVIFGGASGTRKIPGHGAGMPSKFLDVNRVFDVIHVSDSDCVKGCRSLLTSEAILAGGSSGGIVTAYEKYQNKLPRDSVSVLLFPDRGERYLDTIYNEEWVVENVSQDTDRINARTSLETKPKSIFHESL